MISVIVPVYNVEPYLRRCLDSIVNQTYRNLEILVIDDGSTDGCSKICDEYGEKDQRLRVFHTKNRGLSEARNLGLDEAKGEWIGFVDSDDWIETDMYEVLLNRAEETVADIVECGWFYEYKNKSDKNNGYDLCIRTKKTLQLLVQGNITDVVWNKLWKRKCFDNIRFPCGRLFEDIATTHKILVDVDCISMVRVCKYHYEYRDDSISHTTDLKSLVDYWMAIHEKYMDLLPLTDKSEKQLLIKGCALAVGQTWARYYDFAEIERHKYKNDIGDMYRFVKDYIPLFGFAGWELRLRLGVFFPHFFNEFSFWMSWKMNRLYKKFTYGTT